MVRADARDPLLEGESGGMGGTFVLGRADPPAFSSAKARSASHVTKSRAPSNPADGAFGSNAPFRTFA